MKDSIALCRLGPWLEETLYSLPVSNSTPRIVKKGHHTKPRHTKGPLTDDSLSH